MMKQRDKFEAFIKQCRPSWSLRRYAGGEYMDSRTDFAWEIWMEATKL